MLGSFPLGGAPLGSLWTPSSGVDVTTTAGLLSVLTSLQGSVQVSVETSDGLLTATASLEGSSSLGLRTVAGLLETTTALASDTAYVSVTVSTSLLETTTSLLGTVAGEASVTTEDGLLLVLTELLGYSVSLGQAGHITLKSSSQSWEVESTTVQRAAINTTVVYTLKAVQH